MGKNGERISTRPRFTKRAAEPVIMMNQQQNLVMLGIILGDPTTRVCTYGEPQEVICGR
jgi:hypothetical protein